MILFFLYNFIYNNFCLHNFSLLLLSCVNITCVSVCVFVWNSIEANGLWRARLKSANARCSLECCANSERLVMWQQFTVNIHINIYILERYSYVCVAQQHFGTRTFNTLPKWGMHTACLQRQAQTPTTRCLPQAVAESMSFLLVFCFCCPMLPCIACFLARYNRTLYYFRVVVVVIVIVAVAVAVRFSCYYAFYTLELFKTLVVNA